MFKVICLAQAKGGTSKTTSTLSIGASLVKKGYKVLLVDVDPQASLTVSLGVDPATLAKSMRALFTEADTTPEEILISTEEGIDLLPANLDLSLVERKMRSYASEKVLAEKLRPFSRQREYDFVLIDTPPSFSMPTVNALAASDYTLVPIQPEPLCLVGMSQFSEAFKDIKNHTNPRLKLLGIFVTLFDGRIRSHREIDQKIREDWEKLVFQTIIRRRSNVMDAALEGRSIIHLKANSEISKDYQGLTEEVLQRVQQV